MKRKENKDRNQTRMKKKVKENIRNTDEKPQFIRNKDGKKTSETQMKRKPK